MGLTHNTTSRQHLQIKLQHLLSTMKLICALALVLVAAANIEAAAIQQNAYGLECQACMYVMGYIDSYLSGDETEQEIIDIMGKVCTKLPASVSSKCNLMVTMFGKQIVDAIVNELAPNTICPAIGMC